MQHLFHHDHQTPERELNCIWLIPSSRIHFSILLHKKILKLDRRRWWWWPAQESNATHMTKTLETIDLSRSCLRIKPYSWKQVTHPVKCSWRWKVIRCTKMLGEIVDTDELILHVLLRADLRAAPGTKRRLETGILIRFQTAFVTTYLHIQTK